MPYMIFDSRLAYVSLLQTRSFSRYLSLGTATLALHPPRRQREWRRRKRFAGIQITTLVTTTWAITIRIQVPVTRVVATLHLCGYLTLMWLHSFSQFLSESVIAKMSPFYRFLFSFFRSDYIRILFYRFFSHCQKITSLIFVATR